MPNADERGPCNGSLCVFLRSQIGFERNVNMDKGEPARIVPWSPLDDLE